MHIDIGVPKVSNRSLMLRDIRYRQARLQDVPSIATVKGEESKR